MNAVSTAIDQFSGEFAFLANDYPAPVVYEGVVYSTAEHAYQAAKTENLDQRRSIQAAATAVEARTRGASVTLRPNWHTVSLRILEEILRDKFMRNPELYARLLETGTARLVNGNDAGDLWYGCIWNSAMARWIGKNHLGRILMRLRDEFRRQHESA